MEYHNRHDEEVQILYLLFTHINRHYTIFTVSFQEYKYILPTNLNVLYHCDEFESSCYDYNIRYKIFFVKNKNKRIKIRKNESIGGRSISY